MDWTIAALLITAGIAGGIINAVAGGATLITFPAMLVAGLPPVTANASNAVAVSPGHLIAALADRNKLPPFDARFAWSLAISVLGGIGGALLLLALPERLFILPVPALIGFATLLFAFAPQIQAWAERRRNGVTSSAVGELTVLAGASIYGGFFGAGLGIVLTAILSIAEPNDIRKVKVLKNLLAAGVSVAAIAVFVVQGMVQWRETTLMLLGALVGGYAGGYLVRVLPAHVVRWAVITVGTVMTAIYIRRYWF